MQDKLKAELEKNWNFFKNEISTLSVGRATPHLVEGIEIEAYGSMVPLKQVATINIPDPRTLSIQPFDRSQIKDIEKAIIAANLGFTPNNNGQAVIINVPQPTEERRKELTKVLGKILEDARVGVRGAREDAMKEIKAQEKAGDLSEDERFTLQEEIQKMVDEANKKLEEEAERKEKEIMTV